MPLNVRKIFRTWLAQFWCVLIRLLLKAMWNRVKIISRVEPQNAEWIWLMNRVQKPLVTIPLWYLLVHPPIYCLNVITFTCSTIANFLKLHMPWYVKKSVNKLIHSYENIRVPIDLYLLKFIKIFCSNN